MKRYFEIKSLFSIVLVIFLFLPVFSSASSILQLKYPEIAGIKMEDIAANPKDKLNEFIAWFYYFIVSIGGIAAFVMLVWGGFVWLTSAGSPARIADAKDRIYSAFLGLLLILASYLIIQIINPELLMLNLRGLP